MVEIHQKTEDIYQVIDAAVEGIKDRVPEKFVPMIKEALVKIEKENITPQEAMGISEEVLEEIYEYGYHCFQSGKFKDALIIFNILDQWAGSSNPRFLFAIAATHHHMKHYQEAAGYYMLYEILHPRDPLPYYYLYDCFKKLNHPDLALNALRAAGDLATSTPKYEKLKAKIDVELNHLASLENNSSLPRGE